MLFTRGWIKRLSKAFAKGHWRKKKNHLSLPLKMCCSLLLSFITLTEYTSYAIKFSPFLLNICEFQRKVQPNTVSTIEVGVYVLSPLLSLILSIWRWKDLSCCFLLLHYLLPCAALLAGFISDFAGCFWGSLWNVFLTPNNPLPAFPLCSLPLLWKQKKEKKIIIWDFQSETTQNLKLKSIQRCP